MKTAVLLIHLALIWQVGCDGVVGSEKSLDRCGVCGGDNSSCRLVSGLFTRPLLPGGYNLITQIPRGACNLTVSEMKHTTNFLALRYRNGSYILNGDWAINWSGDYEGAGTKFTYRRGSNNVGQYLSSPGPLMEPLDLMVVFQQTNPGIKYEYQLSMESPNEAFLPANSNLEPDVQMMLASEEVSRHGSKYLPNGLDSFPADEASSSSTGNKPKTKTKKRKFIWRHSGYSECTRPCAGGVQNPIFTCVRENNLQPVLEKRCTPQEKPALRPVRCNTKPCMPQWAIGEWEACSADCGPGFQTRTVVCQQEITPTLIITMSPSACTSPGVDQIATRQPCYRPCEPNVTAYWSMGEWGPCSSTCGPGYKSRTVRCSSQQEDDCAPHEKPPNQVPCDSGPCQSFTWLATEWSEQCSEECGTGLQTRQVHCTAGPDKEHLCDVQARPVTLRPCSSDKDCGGKWFTGPWSQCSEPCGHGKQSRQAVCVRRVRNEYVMAADSYCVTSERPLTQQSCMLTQCPRWYAGEWSPTPDSTILYADSVSYAGEWSPCSMPCDTGVQKREVQCLDGEEQPSQGCTEQTKPVTRQACNTHSCSAQSDVNSENNLGDQAPTQIDLHPNTLYSPDCTDQFKNCHLVVQARLCKFKYYHQSCCQACTSRDQSSPIIEN
ncbi:hypothetical protein M8J77_019926 [Diaphorina citri]|nr:hypothetical protein M8J77_019926 [Diaphorina citri]